MLRNLRSWAASSALMIIYLCHVTTASDEPARSRPPGMIMHVSVFEMSRLSLALSVLGRGLSRSG